MTMRSSHRLDADYEFVLNDLRNESRVLSRSIEVMETAQKIIALVNDGKPRYEPWP